MAPAIVSVAPSANSPSSSAASSPPCSCCRATSPTPESDQIPSTLVSTPASTLTTKTETTDEITKSSPSPRLGSKQYDTACSQTQQRRRSRVKVRCEVRARIPSEFGGECFLHLYSTYRSRGTCRDLSPRRKTAVVTEDADMHKGNGDLGVTGDVTQDGVNETGSEGSDVDKEEWEKEDGEEHVAVVFGHDIRSTSLDMWRPGDTLQKRLIRGASPNTTSELDRLDDSSTTDSPSPSSSSSSSSTPSDSSSASISVSSPSPSISDSTNSPLPTPPPSATLPPPLARIHSCCFTGEVIGSLRCDCAEQLQEAMKLMGNENRGVVLYLRQEGRGIGLMEKLKAYNLIDQGADTLTANVLLGHPPDAREYAVASAILRDLAIEDVRLLTNNPDKLDRLSSDGIRVVERVPMVPKSWRDQHQQKLHEVVHSLSNRKRAHEDDEESSESSEEGSVVVERNEDKTNPTVVDDSSPVLHIHKKRRILEDRDTYLVTKIQKMGHMLDIPEPILSTADGS
ncbi:GTP cyclohydrolase II [Quaeritorhiza haematococci]|nr:GTP cyclohydrolase II [Quaeritorhiza haematococci]